MDDQLGRRLQSLHEEYTALVNAAIAENRLDLVAELADRFPEDALDVMTGAM
jgi:hypothetical protein